MRHTDYKRELIYILEFINGMKTLSDLAKSKESLQFIIPEMKTIRLYIKNSP